MASNPTQISVEQRESFRSWAVAGLHWPDSEWLDGIISKKKKKVETETAGEYFTLCDAGASNKIKIARIITEDNGKYIFELEHPADLQPVQAKLFDL